MKSRGVMALALLAAAACGGQGEAQRATEPGAHAPSGISAAPTTATSTTTPATTTTKPPPTAWEWPVGHAPAARMTASWRPGCPVPLADLRLLEVNHWGFDGQPHRGELVVHADVAEDVVSVFEALFEARFPIAQVRLVDEFGGDDDRSMAANNTSGFNCRPVEGTSRWSMHAYGRAIDVNPVENPYVRGEHVSPPAGRAYVERTRYRPGMILARGVLVRAFETVGWKWGGRFRDYQHFSTSGG